MRFKTKPFEIEAVQFTGHNAPEVQKFAGNEGVYSDYEQETVEGLPTFVLTDKYSSDHEQTAQVYDKLHDTWVGVKPGDWIIKGQKGEFYPCDPEIFAAKYEAVDGS